MKKKDFYTTVSEEEIKKRKTFSWMSPKLIVKNIESYGHGVFAKQDIQKDNLLAVFGGYVMTRKEENELEPGMRDEAMQIYDDLVIGVKFKENQEPTSYFNHSCEPNAGFNGQILLVAMRDINTGEQITFDYGMVLHRALGSKKYVLDCLCNSTNCRKKITEDDWLLPELQKKYNGYFQYYLQKKIDKIKSF